MFYTVTFIIEGDNILGVRHEQYIFGFPHSISIIYFCANKYLALARAEYICIRAKGFWVNMICFFW